MKWLAVLKDYWGIGLALVGALILWGSLPERVKKVEAGQASQQEDIVDLKGVAGKLDGYIAAQQQMNQLLMKQQQATLPAPVVSAVRPWMRLDKQGEIECCYEEKLKQCRRSWEACGE